MPQKNPFFAVIILICECAWNFLENSSSGLFFHIPDVSETGRTKSASGWGCFAGRGFSIFFSHSEVWNFFRIRAISVGYPALTAGFVLLAEMDNESDGPV